MRLSAKGTSNPTSKGRINARDRKRVRNSEKRQMRKFLSKTLFLDKAMPITKKNWQNNNNKMPKYYSSIYPQQFSNTKKPKT